MFAKAETLARTERETYATQADMALLDAQGGDIARATTELAAVAARLGAEARIHADLALLYGLGGDRAHMTSETALAGMAPSDTSRLAAWLDGNGTGMAAAEDPADAPPRPRPHPPRPAAPARAASRHAVEAAPTPGGTLVEPGSGGVVLPGTDN